MQFVGVVLPVDGLEGLVSDFGVGHILEKRLDHCRRDVCPLGLGIHRGGNVAENAADAALHLVHVKISHYYYGLQIGPVPFVVKVQYFLALEAVNHLQGADYIAFGLFGSAVYQVGLLVGHTAAAVVAQAPLFANHAALVVQRLLFAADVARPVAQHHQHAVYKTVAHQRDVAQVVDRLGLGGECIHIIAKTDPFVGQELQDALVGIVPGAVEGHMLQKVGQAVLVVLFLQGTYIVRNVKLGRPGRYLVVAQIVSQAVTQLADLEFRVGGDGLGKEAKRAKECRKAQADSFHT